MAQPIRLQIPPRNPRQELHVRMDRAPEQYAEALMAAGDVLQELHRLGVLDLARSALAASGEVLSTLVDDVRGPGALRTLRTALVLSEIVAEVNPDAIKTALAIIPDELSKAAAAADEDPGLLALFRRFRSPEGRRGLAVCISLLESLGRNVDRFGNGGVPAPTVP